MAAAVYQRLNVADRLKSMAALNSAHLAVVDARQGASCTFGELDADATALGRGLIDLGVQPGTRIALLVRPGVEFVKLVFALLRSGATTVLIDPGMGRKNLLTCLSEAEPAGFVAISAAQAVRLARRRMFPLARLNVTVGRRWFWRGPTYSQLLSRGRKSDAMLPATRAADAAAIIFTSGSTGPPKGVLYTHEMFDTQAVEIQRQYEIQPGGADLACFALFGLFNAATGVTTVFPDMNFSRPAAADPRKLLAAANSQQVTQAFASPAVWDKLSQHCELTGERIETLRKVFSCGAPVGADVLRRTLKFVAAVGAQMHTPYGATEALPVSTIEAVEVLGDTAAETARGAGVCVGRKFDAIEWRVIKITDAPIETIADAEELPAGELGELIVRGPQVSQAYTTDSDANALAKIRDGDGVWHRMGDVGYFDGAGRFWYCGRKSQRVETSAGVLFTECVEPIFTQHPLVKRAALVGIGPRNRQTPAIVYELITDNRKPCVEERGDRRRPTSPSEATGRAPAELAQRASAHSSLASVQHFLHFGELPVDVRHNAKINREALAAWAAKQLDSKQ